MTAQKIIDLAKTQLGVKEYPANTNKVKYTAEYGVVTAWCVIFIWWLFKHCDSSKLFYDGKKCASCSQLMNWAKEKGLWVKSNYKIGDLIIYDWNKDGRPEHIGLCVGVEGNSIVAIEGNTAIGNDSNGGQVMTRRRNISSVLGAVRPKYETNTGTGNSGTTNNNQTKGVVKVELTELKQGMKGEQVKTIQRLLKSMGYRGVNNTALGIDGDFGANTKQALIAFQKAKGLTADGICGAKTWSKILKGV